jgi:hypothetical protein
MTVAEALHALDADLVVLTETMAPRTTDLREALRARGWPYMEATSPPRSEYGALIASRAPLRRVDLDGGPAPLPRG